MSPRRLTISITCLALLLSATAAKAVANDLSTVKNRVVERILETKIEDQRIAKILQGAREDGSFTGIHYADLSREASFPHRNHLSNLLSLATVYAQEASAFHRSEDIKDTIARSLEFWVENDFYGENWHNNQVTTPEYLVRIMLLIGREMPDELVQRAQPIINRATMEQIPGVFWGARPGGDRTAIAAIIAKNCLFNNDVSGFAEAMATIVEGIRFNTWERGMQHDLSFHHRRDRVNNTTSYGYGKYANTFGEWSYYVADTKYQFPIDRINLLVDYYLDGLYKHMVYGVFIDVAAMDRSIANQTVSKPAGTREIKDLLRSTDYRSEELKQILKLRNGEPANIRSFAKFFWHSEHFVFQRPHFYTSVRMHSTRNRTYEVPYNGPGITTHHRADGANYLSIDGHEHDGIWSVYDWQKIPGTTVMQKPSHHVARSHGGNMPVQMEGLTDFVGAVTDGRYGAVAFDFKSPHDLLRARKSLFFFDDEYLSLGAGINTDISFFYQTNLPAYTTLNQSRLRGDVAVGSRGKIDILARGTRDLPEVDWVHHDNVGYIFPKPTTVNLSNCEQQGRHSDISAATTASTELLSKDIFLLGINHGNRPDNASYAYIVVPAVCPDEVAATSSYNRKLTILANTPELQAVIHEGLGLCQAAFFSAGKLTVTDSIQLQMGSQAMAMLKIKDDRIESLSISDPSRRLDKAVITLSGIYQTQAQGVMAIPDSESDQTLLIIDLPSGVYAGSSKTIQLHR